MHLNNFKIYKFSAINIGSFFFDKFLGFQHSNIIKTSTTYFNFLFIYIYLAKMRKHNLLPKYKVDRCYQLLDTYYVMVD